MWDQNLQWDICAIRQPFSRCDIVEHGMQMVKLTVGVNDVETIL